MTLNDSIVNELVLEIQRFLVKLTILASHWSNSMTSLLLDLHKKPDELEVSKLPYIIPLVLKKNGI